jgi:hypothetical protein
MARNVARNKITHSIMKVLLRRNLKVSYNAAAFAHKMIVLAYCCVITMEPLTKIEFLNFSLSSEDVEVSIDRTKRDAGYQRTYLLIHPLRSWMSNGLCQDLIDPLALPTPFRPDCYHGTTS